MASPACPPQDLLQSLLIPDSNTTVPAADLAKEDSGFSLRFYPKTGNRLCPSDLVPSKQLEREIRAQESNIPEQQLGHQNMSQMQVHAESPAPVVGAEATDPNVQTIQKPKGLLDLVLDGPPVKLYTFEEWDALHPFEPDAKFQLRWNKEPVPLPPKLNNPEAIPRFNHLCQVHSLTSSFSFNEIEKGRFSSKVRFGEYTYEAAGPFTTKRLAKEAVVESALEILESMKSPLKADKAKIGKRKSSDRDDSPSDEADDNWVTILHEFTQKCRHAQPQFNYIQHNTYLQQQMGLSTSPLQYSCTLALEARPNYTFGSETTHHPSKVEAKRLAAKDAVTWLRAVGKLQDLVEETSAKRRKSIAGEAHTGLTQQTSLVKIEQSPAQLVVSLSLQLRLSPPQFVFDTLEVNFYVCTARYLDQDVRKEPRLEGLLSRTPPVHGQKNAKKLCCQDLVLLLDDIVAGRDKKQ